jgi:hypothetical protein
LHQGGVGKGRDRTLVQKGRSLDVARDRRAPRLAGAALSRARRSQAGGAIDDLPNDMFRRETDRFIHRELRKKPLDVGADRIARTAHAALRLLADLRSELQLPIPLAWEPTLSVPLAVIEVYPAATLKSHGFQASGYKAIDNVAERKVIINSLRGVAALPTDVSSLHTSADALDAVVCMLAGADFLCGAAMPPIERALAEQEGWIWVRAPRAGASASATHAAASDGRPSSVRPRRHQM